MKGKAENFGRIAKGGGENCYFLWPCGYFGHFISDASRMGADIFWHVIRGGRRFFRPSTTLDFLVKMKGHVKNLSK